MNRANCKRAGVLAISVLGLASCGSEGEDVSQGSPEAVASQEPVDAAAATGVPSAFAQCAACHAVDKPEHRGIGPHLVGVFEAEAGSRGDYNYSPALKTSGIVWDVEMLDAYIQSPQRAVSGTKMAFGGVSDDGDRKEVVEYLAELK